MRGLIRPQRLSVPGGIIFWGSKYILVLISQYIGAKFDLLPPTTRSIISLMKTSKGLLRITSPLPFAHYLISKPSSPAFSMFYTLPHHCHLHSDTHITSSLIRHLQLSVCFTIYTLHHHCHLHSDTHITSSLIRHLQLSVCFTIYTLHHHCHLHSDTHITSSLNHHLQLSVCFTIYTLPHHCHLHSDTHITSSLPHL